MSNVLELKKKRYEISKEAEEFANNVISEKNMDLDNVRIKYVFVYPGINKKTAARCMVSNPMMKLFGDCDYVIQISGDLWDQLDENRKKILMWHELLHILPIRNKNGELLYHIREHNVEDFLTILDKHGVNWISDMRTLFSSVYDLDNVDNLNL